MDDKLYQKIMKDAETKVMTVRAIKDRDVDEFHFGDKTKFVSFEMFERTIHDLCRDSL